MPYQVSRNGRSLGDFTLPQIAKAVAAGTLLASDHVWREGMPDWATIGAKGFLNADPAKPAFWDTMREGPHPACCPSCGDQNLKSAQAMYRLGGMAVAAPGILVPQHHPHAIPPAKSSTTATGLLLYVLVWPVTNAICIGGIGALLGFEFAILGMLLSFTCLGLLIWWHLQLIRSNELKHARESYLWRNSWICLGCGQRCLSIDPDAADEIQANP